MAPFSFVTVILWVTFLLQRDLKKAFIGQLTFTIFVSVFIEVGLFFGSEIVNIEYWHITTILTFLNALLLSSKKTQVNKLFLFYVLTLFISLIMLALFPVNKPIVVGSGGVIEEVISGEKSYVKPELNKFSLFYFFFSFFQAYSILIAYNYFEKKDYRNIVRMLSLGSKFIILLVLTEIAIKYWAAPVYGDMLIKIFGLGPSTQTDNHIREGFQMLSGLTREGSHLVYSLFMSIIILFVDAKVNLNKSNNKTFIIFAVLEIGFSMAFTSMLVYVIIFLLYLVYRYYLVKETAPILRRIWLVIVLALTGVLSYPILFLQDNYIARRLSGAIDDMTYLLGSKSNNIISGLEELSSAAARFYSILDAVSLLGFRPLFGVGLGTTFSHGSTAWSLGEMGLLGLFTYLSFIFFSKPIHNKKLTYLVVIFIWLAGNLFVSRPILMVRMDCFLFFISVYLLWDNSLHSKLPMHQ